jgi:hypothetical protein
LVTVFTAPVTASLKAFTAPVTAITATESCRRARFPRRRRPQGQRLSPGRAGGTKSIGVKRTHVFALRSLVPTIKAKSVAQLHSREEALSDSSPSRLVVPRPSIMIIDRLPDLTERIELVIQVTSGHGRARAAIRVSRLVCHFQVKA